jgi:DNA-directed RNA polymerase subunit H
MQDVEDQVWVTLESMLRNRGYTMTQLPRTSKFFVVDGKKKPVLVVFPDDHGIAAVRSAVTAVQEKGGDTVVMVTTQELTHPAAKDVLSIMESERVFITVFTRRQLMFDIYTHVLVPRHRLLLDDEKHALLKRLGVGVEDLRLLKLSDPMARYMGARPGDVFEIRRVTPTVGLDISYRGVV